MNTTKNTLKENCKRFAVMMFAAFLAILPLTSVNVWAYGDLPVYSSPTVQNCLDSPIYAQIYTDHGETHFVAGIDGVDYFTASWGGNIYLYFISSSNNTYVYFNSANNNYVAQQKLNNGYSSIYYVPFGILELNSSLPDLGSFNNEVDVLNYYLQNGVSYEGESAEPIYSTYDIENGYLSVIDLGESGAEYEVTLRTEMPMLSEWLTGKFRYSNQTFWFADSWPTTETQIPNSGATLIEWERYGNRNYMGQTKNANVTLTGISSGRYMYIYNPAGQPNPSIIAVYQANMSMMENNTVHVTIEGFGLDIRVYNSQGSYSASVGGVSGSIVADDDYGEATTTTSGGAMQMTTSGGGIYTQTSGGANDVGLVQSVQNYLDGIQSTLTQFMNNVVSLLTTPIEYISSLIQQGGTFVTNIGQFWNWLPSPLPQYLITAILVVISIGIFHTFL